MRKIIEIYDSQIQRLLEVFPGFIAWAAILFPLWGAFLIPQVVVYFTIGFLVFWFYRSLQTAILSIRGYFKIRQSEETNWYHKYQQNKNQAALKWEEIKHLVIIPNYKERLEKLSTTLSYLANQKDINKDQLIVVLAMEEREAEAQQKATILVEKFKDKFGKLITTFHPDGIPGEVRGKASNEAWAAKKAKAILVDQEGYDINKLIVTTSDADACFHPQYFSALTYEFATHPKRYLRFWQSPVCWYNNFWRVPAPIRIIGTLSSTGYLANIQEPDGLFFNYSAYSLSLKMLDEVGYWHTDIIPEDWHIFLQCFFHQKGKVEVEPIFLPTSIDAPEGKTYWQALKNRYQQCKRHAWGASDIPYAIKEAIKHSEIPFLTRFFRVFRVIESHFIWSTNWFILTLGAWLPALVNPVFKQTTLGYNLPKIARLILSVCLVFLIIMIVIDRALRPKIPKEAISRWYNFRENIQWFLMPIATFFMNILPGLDSQTRLMLGKRIEYQVTEKF